MILDRNVEQDGTTFASKNDNSVFLTFAVGRGGGRGGRGGHLLFSEKKKSFFFKYFIIKKWRRPGVFVTLWALALVLNCHLESSRICTQDTQIRQVSI